MSRFKVGDTVQTRVAYISVDKTSFPAGTVGVICKILGANSSAIRTLYAVDTVPYCHFEEYELQLEETTKCEECRDVVVDQNPDLDKRVSEARDELLRGMFE